MGKRNNVGRPLRRYYWSVDSSPRVQSVHVAFSDLRAACARYSDLGGNFDISLRRFRKRVVPALDLSDRTHIGDMLVWLNSWGCRQFTKRYHAVAADSIACWYQQNSNCIPGPNISLITLPDECLRQVALAYEKLTLIHACDRKREKGSLHRVTCGPTGA